uniref:Uncharacterized protein n=1 Tax=Parastrongyloides trichosuri TaxID=131310 RepID=A0A0N4ZNW5_PARTI
MILNTLSKISNISLNEYQLRNRATYYKQSKSWRPRFIRRFFIRYPKSYLYITTGILIGSFVSPFIYWTYKYNTMDVSEFKNFREQHNIDVTKRQKYGVGLIYPWKSEEKIE